MWFGKGPFSDSYQALWTLLADSLVNLISECVCFLRGGVWVWAKFGLMASRHTIGNTLVWFTANWWIYGSNLQLQMLWCQCRIYSLTLQQLTHWGRVTFLLDIILYCCYPNDGKSSLVLLMDWWWTVSKPLSKSIMTQFTAPYMHHQTSMS